MSSPLHDVDAALDDLWLDLPRLCRLVGVTEDWLIERASLGLLQAQGPDPRGGWRLGAADLRRVRRIASLERDFDAVPELAALVADLEEELTRMRARLDRQRGP